jgi:hypothetical protein
MPQMMHGIKNSSILQLGMIHGPLDIPTNEIQKRKSTMRKRLYYVALKVK